METPLEPITFFYTFGLRGDLACLPRLYTFIQSQRRAVEGRIYLLDLGESCVPDVWPCGVTEGRSTLLALDSMGYDVANVEGVLSDESRAKLAEQALMHLVDTANPYNDEGLFFALYPPMREDQLAVDLSPASETRLRSGVLSLAKIEGGQLGVVRLADGGVTFTVLTMPDGTLPDATIMATIDFIQDETRYFESRRK